MPNHQIQWPCDECGVDVEDGEGYIHISQAAVAPVRRAAAERERTQLVRNIVEPGRPVSLSEYLDGPEPAKWETHHEACDPHLERGDYWIGVERVRTLDLLIDRMLHLGGKPWVGEATNWSDFVGRTMARWRSNQS